MNEKIPANSSISLQLWRFVTIVGAMLCATTLFGFAGRHSWLLDLFSHFRVQYLVLLTLSGIVLLAARHHKTAALFLAFALINLIEISPLYLQAHKTPPANAMTMRIAFINVNTRLGDAARVSAFIREANPDLLVLEETSSKWLQDLAWLRSPYPHSLTEPRDDNFGIAVFSKLPFARSEVVYLLENGVPTIIAEVTTKSGELHILATHPPPPVNREYARLRNAQLEQLPRYVDATKPTLLIGDLNTTPWNHHFSKLLQQTGLLDSARGFGVQPSWPNNNPFLRIPLDHVLHSPDIFVLQRTIGPDVKSDHFPVIVDLALPRRAPAADSSSKIEFDLNLLDKDGLRGPADGKVAVSYEFSIPDNEVFRAEIRAIDPTVQFMPGSRGRIGAGKDECLCIGSTHQENFKEVLRALSEKSYISRIIECHFE